jgi:hypothetical protein
VEWPAGAPNLVVTCTQAVRGQYLYIINGNQGNIILNNVQVIGYLLPTSEVCVACASGKYKASNGTAACSDCESGTASASTAAISPTVCQQCPANTYAGTGAPACSPCPSNSLAAVGSTSSDYCRCDRGYTTAPSTISCTPFQTLYQAKRPWAHYSADGWNSATRVLADQSGNNRHASSSSQMNTITGPFTTREAGALNPISFLRGNSAANLQFPQNSIPVNFTICSVTKYASTDASMQARILTSAEDAEWWHGHYNKKRGVAKFASQKIFSMDGQTVIANSVWNTGEGGLSMNMNWTVMCSKNGGITPWNVLVDGQAAGTSTRSDSNPEEWPGLNLEVRTANMQMNRVKSMCINCLGFQTSAWDLSQLMIWDSHLNDIEMQSVSLELQKYTPLSTVCDVLPGVGCVACPAGKYKSLLGGSACVNCMAGKYRTGTGAIGDNLCIDCPANTFALPGSALQTDCQCNAGYSGAANGVACAACGAGKYKTAVGIGTCTDCAANEYSGTVAQVVSTCSSCPSSSQAPAGSDEAIDCKCNVGYTGANGQVCLGCVQGTYKPIVGPSTCTLCGNNTYSSIVAASSSTVCLACQGNSTSLMGSTRQSDCHCLKGYLTNNLGAPNATCEMCSAGSYNSQLDATTCSKCGAGFKSSTPGAVSSEQCTECGVNTYSAEGAAQCEICPNNTFAPARSDVLGDCKCLAGYYSAVTGEDGRSCSACQAGKHKAQTGAVPCTDCPANRYSTATAATSNATCQACTQNAVAPVGSSALSQCLCDLGYKNVEITANIPNVARSCGTGSDACPVTIDSQAWQSSGGAAFINDDMLTGNQHQAWYSDVVTNLHWARVDFLTETSVTAIQLASLPTAWYDGTSYNGAAVIVGNNVDISSSQNSICKIFTSTEVDQTLRNFNCANVVTGRYLWVTNRFGFGNNIPTRLGIWELKVSGYRVNGNSCGACIAGTFKDTLGSAACTNCPANYYSGLTARTSNATCTPCYENSVSPAGSVSMDACNCVAGYEFT